MAKTQKKTVKITESTIEENDVIVGTNLTEMNLDGSCDNNKCETNDVFTYVKLKPTTHGLSELNVMELVALEEACTLLCKRYETIAQLDYTNNFKFKEYQRYYEMIFAELEKRVAESCKNV